MRLNPANPCDCCGDKKNKKPLVGYVIGICNANKQIDDNFDVYLDGTVIGSLDLDANECNGNTWATDLSLPLSLIDFSGSVLGVEYDGTCCYNLAENAIDIKLFGNGGHVVEMKNTFLNNNGNWGVVRIVQFTRKKSTLPWVVSKYLVYDYYSGPTGTTNLKYSFLI